MKENIEHLIQKQTKSKLNLSEQIELSEKLADPKNLVAEEIFRNDWLKQFVSEDRPERDFNTILDKVHHRIRLNEDQKKVQLNWWTSFQRIAAIFIVPLTLSFLTYFYFQNNQPEGNTSYAEIECPMGVRTKFQLPDGSTGYLNSGSRLKYPVQFSGERKVELTGEAFFDVVHNASLPFHVNTRNLDIKVLGTTFNVIANNDDTSEEIILQTGKVDIATRAGKQLALLSPNERLVLDLEKQSFEKKTVEASQYTSWKEGKLVFRNENMQQVARRLSRWYNADVVVDSKQLDNYAFHATFTDEPLDEVLKLLLLTTPLSFSEEKRTNNSNGEFQKRKIILKINPAKIKHFR
jgi:ferric-dicitrate binding protein FerR (iron transport regulator)